MLYLRQKLGELVRKINQGVLSTHSPPTSLQLPPRQFKCLTANINFLPSIHKKPSLVVNFESGIVDTEVKPQMSFSSHTQDTHYISVCADFYYFCIHLLASFAWSQSLDPTQIERKQNTAQSRFSSFLWGFDGKFQVEFSPFLCTQSLFNTWVHNSLNAISPEGKYLMFFVLNFPNKVFPLLLKTFPAVSLGKALKIVKS